KIGRHFWRHPSVPFDAEDWDRLPGRFGFDPAQEAEWRGLLGAPPPGGGGGGIPRARGGVGARARSGGGLGRVGGERVRHRTARYKTLFDARRKLRAALAANGYLSDDHSRRS